MNKTHNKRLSPRNLIMDMTNALYSHKKILILLNQLTTNEPELGLKDLELINHKLNIDLLEVSSNIVQSISHVIHEYNEASYWRAFNQEEIVIDENTTLGETISFLEQMILVNDQSQIVSHILNGNLIWVINHLDYLCQHSHELSKHIFYDYYRSGFSDLTDNLKDSEDFKTTISNFKKVIHKYKPLKPIKNPVDHQSYFCPSCHHVLYSTKQMYCHYCGQRMNDFQIGKKRST